MKRKIQFHPDAPASTPPTTSTRGWVAQADLDLLSESKRVSTWWLTAPNNTTYPLVYINAAGFGVKVTAFENALTARLAVGATRPQQTKNLNDLDDEVEKALPQMRSDIGSKFGAANRFAMFPQFGFIHYRDAWIFPHDRDDRKQSIKMCKEACIAHGMTTITYNDVWWTQMETDYNAALEATQITDSAISGGVATKNQEREDVDEVMHSLYHVIRGNHPKDYEQILRVAGFQKEDF